MTTDSGSTTSAAPQNNGSKRGQADGRHDAAFLPPFRANEVRLWLSVIAYNLGNLWRRLALATPIGRWSLTSSQQRLVKTGGRLI